MRRLERAHNVQRHDVLRRSTAIAPCRRLALDIFEHQVARADVVDLTDVWVVQRRNRPRFLFEATQTIRVSGEPLPEAP